MDILLKSSALIAIFYLFYYFVLSKETFFNSNRIFLLAGVVLSFIIPFIIIPVYKTIQMDLYSFTDSSLRIDKNLSFEILEKPIGFLQYSTLKILYAIGVIIYLIKFIVSILKIHFAIKANPKVKLNEYNLVKTEEDISPFSFFKTIVINPKKYSDTEYNHIIQHENTHVSQWHSFDMILANILTIVLWFNPIVYLYKRAIEQNLEFIADSNVKREDNNNSMYELLLLNSVVSNYRLQLVNSLFAPTVKKRINMMNTEPSKSINKWKYFILLPVLSVFLYSFNTKKMYRVEGSQQQIGNISFIHPLKNHKEIASKFGERRHPLLKINKFHKGVDYKVDLGTEVLASMDGIVKSVGSNKEEGYYIVISNENGFVTKYGHLSKIIVQEGKAINQGQVIGLSGISGNSSGPNLHFEILKNNKHLNPELFLSDRKIKAFSIKNNDILKKDLLDLNKGDVKIVTVYPDDSIGINNNQGYFKIDSIIDHKNHCFYFMKDSFMNTILTIKVN